MLVTVPQTDIPSNGNGQNIQPEKEENFITCQPCRHVQLDKLTAAVTRTTIPHKK